MRCSACAAITRSLFPGVENDGFGLQVLGGEIATGVQGVGRPVSRCPPREFSLPKSRECVRRDVLAVDLNALRQERHVVEIERFNELRRRSRDECIRWASMWCDRDVVARVAFTDGRPGRARHCLPEVPAREPSVRARDGFVWARSSWRPDNVSGGVVWIEVPASTQQDAAPQRFFIASPRSEVAELDGDPGSIGSRVGVAQHLRGASLNEADFDRVSSDSIMSERALSSCYDWLFVDDPEGP